MAPTRSRAKEPAKRHGRPPKNQSSTAAKIKPKAVAPRQKRGRKPKQRAQSRVEKPIQGKKRGRPSKTQEPPPESPIEDRGNVEDEDEDELARAEPQAQKSGKLVERTRRVPLEKIDTWPEMSPQMLDEVMALLSDAKRDIYNTTRDDRKASVEKQLNALLRLLRRELLEMRVPPQAKDFHFNIDKLTERLTQLYQEVTMQRHSEQLLQEQVKVAERLLAKDRRNLDQLRKNARNWKTTWNRREQSGRLHPLLQGLDDDAAENDGPDDIGLKRTRAANVSIPDGADPELTPLLEQLRRSLENMQGNHEQVAGLDEAMRDAGAALDGVLYRRASAPQYAAL